MTSRAMAVVTAIAHDEEELAKGLVDELEPDEVVELALYLGAFVVGAVAWLGDRTGLGPLDTLALVGPKLAQRIEETDAR